MIQNSQLHTVLHNICEDIKNAGQKEPTTTHRSTHTQMASTPPPKNESQARRVRRLRKCWTKRASHHSTEAHTHKHAWEEKNPPQQFPAASNPPVTLFFRRKRTCRSGGILGVHGTFSRQPGPTLPIQSGILAFFGMFPTVLCGDLSLCTTLNRVGYGQKWSQNRLFNFCRGTFQDGRRRCWGVRKRLKSPECQRKSQGPDNPEKCQRRPKTTFWL